MTWHSYHIYYAANPRPLLLQCVRPLVTSLDEDGVLAGYFFIRYWLEGPHIRLRLQSLAADADDVVRDRTEEAITGFLRRRPSLYGTPGEAAENVYNALFALEFTAQERTRYLDANGRMRMRENNTFSREAYQPEYDKYGGPRGVELAEWHFRQSSDLVIEATRTLNLHLRSVTLGFAAQLMMVMTSCFFPDEGELATFLAFYRDYWTAATAGTEIAASGSSAGFARSYEAMAATLPGRFAGIRSAVGRGVTAELPGFLRRWADHCLELSERAAGLTLPAPWLALPYLHMTSNRMGIGLIDEAFLAYLLGRALGLAVAA